MHLWRQLFLVFKSTSKPAPPQVAPTVPSDIPISRDFSLSRRGLENLNTIVKKRKGCQLHFHEIDPLVVAAIDNKIKYVIIWIYSPEHHFNSCASCTLIKHEDRPSSLEDWRITTSSLEMVELMIMYIRSQCTGGQFLPIVGQIPVLGLDREALIKLFERYNYKIYDTDNPKVLRVER